MNDAPQAHVLVVDDDARLRALLQKFLARNGFLVTTARDAAHARSLLEGLEFDLIVLDVMMPGEDGLAADRQPARDDDDADPAADRPRRRRRPHPRARGRRRRLPAKPFEPRELLLRINAILRRVPKPQPRAEPPKTLQLGEVRYDMNRGELWRGRDLIRLTATEAMLMRIFAARAHEPVTRQRAGRGPRRRRRRGAGARRRRADHPPAPQDRGRPARAALPADRPRLGLHAGAGLTGRHLPPFESPRRLACPRRGSV